jgi:hypothetical protein
LGKWPIEVFPSWAFKKYQLKERILFCMKNPDLFNTIKLFRVLAKIPPTLAILAPRIVNHWNKRG